MSETKFFTAAEHHQLIGLYKQLLRLTADTLQKDDCRKLKERLIDAASQGDLTRDVFGMNPVLLDMQTAVIMADELGMKRASILSIILHRSADSDPHALDRIKAEYGTDVAKIIRGLIRINDLYAKNPTIESENFRNLLLSFAEDMRIKIGRAHV